MCLFPIKCIKYGIIDNYTGEYKHQLKFIKKEENIQKVFDNMIYKDKEIIEVPCNSCVECLQKKSIEWSFRIRCEASYHKENCFITLTYKNTNGELSKRDFQLFMKRLRKSLKCKVRYFACGEYGSKGFRPHYHLVLFGFIPKDLIPLYFEKDYIVYRSPFIEKIWGLGFISIMTLNEHNSKYVAKYMQKLNDFPNKRVQPFLLMSNRPGIAYRFFNDHLQGLLEDDRLYIEGYYIALPRYCLKIAERNAFDLSVLKENRIKIYNFKKPFIDLKVKREKLSNYFTKLI